MVLLDAALKSGIEALRYSASLDRSVQLILVNTQKEIIRQLAIIDPFGVTAKSYQNRRLAKLNKIISAILKKDYTLIKDMTSGSLADFAEEDVKGLLRRYNADIGASIFSYIKSPAELRAIANSTLIDGQVIGEWWNGQAKSTKDKLERAMKDAQVSLQTGLTKNETVDQLTKRITGSRTSSGILKTSKSQAKALVRTSVMQVHNDANKMFMEDNSDVIDMYQWLSTLDSKTTAICRALDKKLYSKQFRPIGHNIRYPGIPAHWNCRSILLPITKSYDQLLGTLKGAKKAQLTQISGKTRAAMGTPVSADHNYNSWLKTQTKKTQLKVLGPGRYDLWKDGKLSMADMVNQDGRPLTLKQLKSKRKASEK